MLNRRCLLITNPQGVAESLNVTDLPNAVTSTLPSSSRSCTQGSCQVYTPRSTTNMTTDGTDRAFRVPNIEPLYGHSPHNSPTFTRSISYPPISTTGTLLRRGMRRLISVAFYGRRWHCPNRSPGQPTG